MSWRVSVTLDSTFCIAALEEAIARYGCPTITNTDQASPFTSAAFTGALLHRGIRISMDGRGCWRDNIFVERLWRSLEYEEVYLHGYDSVSTVTAGIARYVTLYNSRRPHSSLNDCTPDHMYFASTSLTAAAESRSPIHLSNPLRLYREAERLHRSEGQGEIRRADRQGARLCWR